MITGGKWARTDFKICRAHEHLALLELVPITGQTHQIRVHCRENGFPILGDTLYGDSNRDRSYHVCRLMLHAKDLKVPHPTTGKMLHFHSLPSKEFEPYELKALELPNF